MIPLRLQATSDAAQPFLVRLRSEATALGLEADTSPFDASLERFAASTAHYATAHGPLELRDTDPAEAENDVLLIDPRRSIAHRLIRAASAHNTFLVTERCDQLCSMCSQPPKEHHVDMFPFYEIAAQLAPVGAVIGLSGGEPTLYKLQLFAFLERTLAARPDLRFHILTNGQHFTTEDSAWLVRLPAGHITWGVPLYSTDPHEHDRIVGKAGAFNRLLISLAILGRSGANVELRTVVIQDNVNNLPELARFITTMLPFVSVWALMQLENIGFARKNWSSLFWDSSATFDTLGAAIDLARARGVEALLYNFPLCTVPTPYRQFAPSTISDWKRRLLDICTACSLRETCGGFFEWYPERQGFSHLEAE